MCHLIVKVSLTVVAKANPSNEALPNSHHQVHAPRSQHPIHTYPPSLLHHATASSLTPVPACIHPCLSPAGVLDVRQSPGSLFPKAGNQRTHRLGLYASPVRSLGLCLFPHLVPRLAERAGRNEDPWPGGRDSISSGQRFASDWKDVRSSGALGDGLAWRI